jgi:NADPH:quinone reductase-like Zn-dependent oxidoreductase
MHAAVLHALGEVPRFEEFPDPEPRAETDEVLLEVSAAALCAIDRAIARGAHYYKPAQWPVVCGTNGAGRLPDGTRVLFGGVRAPYGTMAQYALASRRLLSTIPDGVEDVLAAAAFNPGVSASLTLGWRAKLTQGESVLISGATGVTGRLAVQFARRLGARKIVAAGRNLRALEQLKTLGAHETIDLNQADDAIEAAFLQHGAYDVIVDYLWGHPTELLLRTLGHHDLDAHPQRTRLVQVGEMAGSHISLPAALLRSSALEIMGHGTGQAPGPEVLAKALSDLLALLASGEFQLEVERVPLSQVSEYWNRDQQGRRPVFVP